MTKYIISLFILLLIGCSNTQTQQTTKIVLPKVNREDSILTEKRKELRPLILELSKKLSIPTLLDSIHLAPNDSTSFAEYRITLFSGGHSLSNTGCVFRIIVKHENDSYKDFFEAYTYHYNKTIASPFVDSVKKISSIALDKGRTDYLFYLFDKNCFQDQSEYTHYSNTAGGKAIYELFVISKGQVIDYRRVVKLPNMGFSDINDTCYKIARLNPEILFK
jgi:hypothetical protein